MSDQNLKKYLADYDIGENELAKLSSRFGENSGFSTHITID